MDMIIPADGTLRAAICNAAKANSSGPCKQVYLDETHNGDLKVPVKKFHWCGVYAAWVWRQAHALVWFRRGDKTPKKEFGGIWRESPNQYLGSSGKWRILSPGDIIVFQPNPWVDENGKEHLGRNHHAIVTAVSIKTTRNGMPEIVDLVEGNTGNDDTRLSVVKATPGMNLARNTEDKQFYSVETFENPKIRF